MNTSTPRLQCGGQCGVAACAFATNSTNTFKHHVKSKQICAMKRTQREERKRGDRPAKKTRTGVVLRNPFRHGSRERMDEFIFVRRLVSNCIGSDIRNKVFSDKKQALVDHFRGSEVLHDISLKVLQRFKKMDPTKDDAGGDLPAPGMLLRTHALWALSLDRIDNKKTHFSFDYSKLLDNLNMVILGMNNGSCIVSKHGKNTCAVLRRRMKDRPTRKEVNAALDELAKMKAYQHFKTKAMCSMRNVWRRDRETRKYFDNDWFLFVEYCKALLIAQDYMCALSGIFMGRAGGEDDKFFQVSLDAIEATKHHVPGNLR